MKLTFCGKSPQQRFFRIGVVGNNLADDLTMIIDKKQGNLNLLKRGMDTIKVSDEQLRRISDAIGTEAALGLMLTVGKLTQDSVGVSGTGTGGGGDESLFDLILSKRDE